MEIKSQGLVPRTKPNGDIIDCTGNDIGHRTFDPFCTGILQLPQTRGAAAVDKFMFQTLLEEFLPPLDTLENFEKNPISEKLIDQKVRQTIESVNQLAIDNPELEMVIKGYLGEALGHGRSELDRLSERIRKETDEIQTSLDSLTVVEELRNRTDRLNQTISLLSKCIESAEKSVDELRNNLETVKQTWLEKPGLTGEEYRLGIKDRVNQVIHETTKSFLSYVSLDVQAAMGMLRVEMEKTEKLAEEKEDLLSTDMDSKENLERGLCRLNRAGEDIDHLKGVLEEIKAETGAIYTAENEYAGVSPFKLP
jgi:uncharacterized protein (UPF0335 family)